MIEFGFNRRRYCENILDAMAGNTSLDRAYAYIQDNCASVIAGLSNNSYMRELYGNGVGSIAENAIGGLLQSYEECMELQQLFPELA